MESDVQHLIDFMNIYFTLQVILSSYLLCKENWPGGPSLQQYYSLVRSRQHILTKFVISSEAFDTVLVEHAPHMDFLSVT